MRASIRASSSKVDRHLSGRVERAFRLDLGVGEEPFRLGPGVGDRRVGRALGEQQRARDRFRRIRRDTDLLGIGCRRRCRLGHRGRGGRRCRRFGLERLVGRCQLLQPGDGGARPGLHGGRLLLGFLERFCDACQEGIDFVGVVPFADGSERCARHQVGCQLHGGRQSS